MNPLRAVPRTAVLVVLGVGTAVWYGCTDGAGDLTGPAVDEQVHVSPVRALETALAVHGRHTAALMRTPGVVGTAVGLSADGRPAVQLYLVGPDVRGLPESLDGVPVTTEVTGQFVALADPTQRQRPAPVGFSVGHPDITAGTIGARVIDGLGQVFVLSNNHVLADANDASLGDPILQPGAFDGGTLNDQIGTLSAFQPLDFTGAPNTIDAAIALTSADNVDNATPADDGYGTPNAVIFGDGNNDGVFDNPADLLGLNVQKYGRTTQRTTGQVTGINATVDVCYEVLFGFFCTKLARFVDQIIVEPGSFSGGGDSGSLIVTDDENRHPVGLLFAGSAAQTIANRIDNVLNRFGVTIDGGPSTPPTPVTDVAVTSVDAPGSVTAGDVVTVDVTVRNVGNQDVSDDIGVTLRDATDGQDLGTQTVAGGLAAGASATVSFQWNTTGSSIGDHLLVASQDFVDDEAGNDEGAATVTVEEPGTGGTFHVGDLDAFSSRSSFTWSATVEITVHDANHTPMNGATVVGAWSRSGLNSNTCTTGELGGNGSCIVLFPSLSRRVRRVRFTVTSVTFPGLTYESGQNHDVDGDSDGTSITVNRP